MKIINKMFSTDLTQEKEYNLTKENKEIYNN
jgi:hypothetical protein